jgi:hypothetical protein
LLSSPNSPAARDAAKSAALFAALSEVKRHANGLAKLARKIEGWADDTPPE